MKRAIVCLTVFLVLFAAILPSPAAAGCCWWPGAVVGGIVFGAVALATLPLWALSAAFVPPPGPYPPPYYAAPPVYGAPTVYSAPPAYSAPPVYSAPAVSYQRVVTYAPSPAPQVQREIVYPNGRYLLFGDGVTQPWQWAWEPAAIAPPQEPARASVSR
jgi:hypothetical protein